MMLNIAFDNRCNMDSIVCLHTRITLTRSRIAQHNQWILVINDDTMHVQCLCLPITYVICIEVYANKEYNPSIELIDDSG